MGVAAGRMTLVEVKGEEAGMRSVARGGVLSCARGVFRASRVFARSVFIQPEFLSTSARTRYARFFISKDGVYAARGQDVRSGDLQGWSVCRERAGCPERRPLLLTTAF
jgi:hypothetical protein